MSPLNNRPHVRKVAGKKHRPLLVASPACVSRPGRLPANVPSLLTMRSRTVLLSSLATLPT